MNKYGYSFILVYDNIDQVEAEASEAKTQRLQEVLLQGIETLVEWQCTSDFFMFHPLMFW